MARILIAGCGDVGSELDRRHVYLGVDDEPVERDVVLSWLAERLGAPPLRVAETPSRGGNKRCSNARLRAADYRLEFPSFRDGYGAMM